MVDRFDQQFVGSTSATNELTPSGHDALIFSSHWIALDYDSRKSAVTRDEGEVLAGRQ